MKRAKKADSKMSHGRGRIAAPRPRLFAVFALLCIALSGSHSAALDKNRALWMHSDGTYEWFYGAEYDECVPPDYGAFAECYEGSVQIQAVVLDLTSIFYPSWISIDVYVWSDDDGRPGSVLAFVPDWWDGYGIPPFGQWTRKVIELPGPVCGGLAWWAGYWGPWPGEYAEYYICADWDGPGGGTSMYKIAPGLEWPEGWQPVEVRWGPTAALGIGAEVVEIPSPVESKTWGAIKSLFQQ